MRYMDRYVTVNQGEVFYITEALAQLEGLERGPAGNTSLTAAFSLAQEMDKDQIILVQETEYTGAGKHIQPQLSFAKSMGVEIQAGDPRDEICGKNIILPKTPGLIKAVDIDMKKLRQSYIKNAAAQAEHISEEDIRFLAEDTKSSIDFVRDTLEGLKTS